MLYFNGQKVSAKSKLEVEYVIPEIDSVPTEGSENPVTSGGVYEAFFMATKIKETEILVEYGYATEDELKALKDKYIEDIRNKNNLREKIREAESKLQEERLKIINGEVK